MLNTLTTNVDENNQFSGVTLTQQPMYMQVITENVALALDGFYWYYNNSAWAKAHTTGTSIDNSTGITVSTVGDKKLVRIYTDSTKHILAHDVYDANEILLYTVYADGTYALPGNSTQTLTSKVGNVTGSAENYYIGTISASTDGKNILLVMHDAGGSMRDLDEAVTGTTAVNITAGGVLTLAAGGNGSFGSATFPIVVDAEEIRFRMPDDLNTPVNAINVYMALPAGVTLDMEGGTPIKSTLSITGEGSLAVDGGITVGTTGRGRGSRESDHPAYQRNAGKSDGTQRRGFDSNAGESADE